MHGRERNAARSGESTPASLAGTAGLFDDDAVAVARAGAAEPVRGSAPVDPVLLRTVYLATFHLQDGSTLASLDASALDSMRGSLQRLLTVGDPSAELLGAARAIALLQGRRRGSRFI